MISHSFQLKMVSEFNVFLFLAVTTLVCVFKPTTAVNITVPTFDPLKPLECDDCCSYLQCLGMVDSNNHFKDTVEVMGMDTICKPLNRALLPICLSKSNIQDCSYMKKLIPKLPSQTNLAEGLEVVCKQKDMVSGIKNLTDCMIAQNVSVDSLDRCVGPFLNGMKDDDSDVCDVVKTMSNCMEIIVKRSKCHEVYQDIFKGTQGLDSNNPFCRDTNNSQKHIVNFTFVLFVTFFTFMLK